MTEYESRHASGDQPLGPGRSVETIVVPDRGQWSVDIVVLFDDGMVRRRINTYRSERMATISANLIRRAAERDIGSGPVNG